LKDKPGGDDKFNPIEAWRKKAPSGSEEMEYEWCAKI